MSLDDLDNPLAVEIRQESAAAYFAACRQMVDALEALKTFDPAGFPSEAKAQERRMELVDHAAERVFYVIIQREAMKLTRTETFLDDYEVPNEVRMRMGPKSKG